MLNVQEIIVEYLNDEMDVKAYAEAPNFTPDSDNPEQYIVVQTTSGGTYDGHTALQSQSFAIQAIASSLYDAAELARKTASQMVQIADDRAELAHSQIGAPYNFSDDRCRYQFTAEIVAQETD